MPLVPGAVQEDAQYEGVTSTSMRLLPLVLLIVSAACRGDRELRHDEIERLGVEHAAESARFAQIQAQFAQRNPVPHQFDFQDHGTILVHECGLEGSAGRAALWLRYTWVNTTGHPVRQARITIVLRDPGHGVERSEAVQLDPPLGGAFGRESCYTTFVRVPIEDSLLSADLTWEIRARVVGPTDGS